jgi:hypothetical protein
VTIFDFTDVGITSSGSGSSGGLYSSPDLLARFKRYARRPTTDESLSDDAIYELLTEAQQEAAAEVALHIPGMMVGDPTLLSSSDGGVTYSFGNDADGNAIVPLVAELYAAVNGRELFASSYANRGGDFVIEGTKVRIPGNQSRVFAIGPYARFFATPGVLDADHDPTLVPMPLRTLIVARGLEKWAAIGGLRDRSPFTDLWTQAFRLVLGMKHAYVTRNAVAREGLGSGVWWTSLSTRSLG